MEIRVVFNIFVIFLLYGVPVYARIVPVAKSKHGIGCIDLKGRCCTLEKQYRLGEIMIEKPNVDKCEVYICTDNNFKLLEEIPCTADDMHVTETKTLMKHIKLFMKQLNQNRIDKDKIAENKKLGYHRILQKFKRFKTTTPTPTPPPGCYGFSHTTGRSGNWCYGTYCDQNGNVINWDNFNCGPTTQTTIPPTTTTPFYTTPLYCVYQHNGHYSFHKGGSSFVNLDGVKCECTFYGRIECDPNNVVG